MLQVVKYTPTTTLLASLVALLYKNAINGTNVIAQHQLINTLSKGEYLVELQTSR